MDNLKDDLEDGDDGDHIQQAELEDEDAPTGAGTSTGTGVDRKARLQQLAGLARKRKEQVSLQASAMNGILVLSVFSLSNSPKASVLSAKVFGLAALLVCTASCGLRSAFALPSITYIFPVLGSKPQLACGHPSTGRGGPQVQEEAKG